MDMFDGVGRRRDEDSGKLVSIGEHSLNGYERNCLFRNNADGTFTDVGFANGADLVEDGRGVSVFDYDLDGSLDIAVRNYRQPAALLRNTGAAGRWLAIRLVGTKSNRDAVGARVTLRAAGSVQSREVRVGSGYLSTSSLTQHFGLGAVERIDSVEVRWPSGEVTALPDLAANQRLMLREGERAAVAVERWIYPPPTYAATE